jgi:hypothetical protein
MDSPAEIVEMQSQLPVYAAYTPNLLPSTFFVDDDDWRADPSMWANDDFTPAFVENSGLVASDLTNNLPVTESEFRSESSEGDWTAPANVDTTSCEDCEATIRYEDAFDWEGFDRCEDCYDHHMMKDRQNYTGDETDCVICGYSISPNDSRFELVEGVCPDCKNDARKAMQDDHDAYLETFERGDFFAEDENYMVSSDAHRLDEGSANIQKIVSSDASIDYPEWWKSKLTVAATEVDQLSDFLSFVTSNKTMWSGFSAESSVAEPEFTEEGYPIMIEDIAFPGLSYVYYELRPGVDGSSEEIVYILNPFTADRESLEEINAALDSGYLELYKVIPVSEMEKEFAAEYRPGLIKAKKLDLIPPAEITAGKFLGMGTCSGCNTMDTEIFQGVPYSLCESCYDEMYLSPCSVCNLEGDVHDMYLDEDMGIEDVLICDECIDNYAK